MQEGTINHKSLIFNLLNINVGKLLSVVTFLFNPFGVVWRFVRIRGFHPRLFKFNPVGLFNGINSFHRLWVVKIWVKESFFQGWVGVIAFSIRLVSVWSKGLSMTTAA